MDELGQDPQAPCLFQDVFFEIETPTLSGILHFRPENLNKVVEKEMGK